MAPCKVSPVPAFAELAGAIGSRPKAVGVGCCPPRQTCCEKGFREQPVEHLPAGRNSRCWSVEGKPAFLLKGYVHITMFSAVDLQQVLVATDEICGKSFGLVVSPNRGVDPHADIMLSRS